MTRPELQCFYCGRRGTRGFEPAAGADAAVWCSSGNACRRRRARALAGRSSGAVLLELRQLWLERTAE